jgi:hypothetical protein
MIKFSTTLKGSQAARANLEAMKAKFPVAVHRQTLLQAHRLRGIVVKGIRSQAPGGVAFKPLAESTKAMKKSSKALINHGDLMRSIGVEDVGGDTFFIGVNRNAVPKTKDGEAPPNPGQEEKLFNIAEVHETGTAPFAIPVTSRMRRFWHAMVEKGVFKAPLKPTTVVLQHPGIPARPFMAPSYDEWAKDLERLYMEGLSAALGVKP